MKSARVDPRDVWFEVDPAAFRVYFWNPPTSSRAGWLSDEWRLDETRDVAEVLAWANETSSGRLFVLYAEQLEKGHVTLVRLAGEDPVPTKSSTTPSKA
jgi:hypothetical protein